MNQRLVCSRSGQRGATLVIGLILLTLIALAVSTAFLMSSSNLQSVGNMQRRDESIATANFASEQVISGIQSAISAGTPFVADEINVDVDRDGTNDYQILVAQPSCIEAKPIAGSGQGNQCSINVPCNIPGGSLEILLDISAEAKDVRSAGSDSRVVVRQGIRVLIPESLKCTYCSNLLGCPSGT